MAKCKWSVEGICQCFVTGDGKHPACNGHTSIPCGQASLDLTDIRDIKPKKNPGRGGKRPGAGAPRGNLNALKDGVYSLQLKRIRLDELRILRTTKEKRAKRNGNPATS